MEILLHKGFTLVEVLVSLVILSMALNAFYFAFSANANAVRYLEEKTVAEWVALNLIAEAKLGVINVRQSGETWFSETMSRVQWQSQLVLSPTLDPHVLRLHVSVRKEKDSSLFASVSAFLPNEALSFS